MNFIIDPVTFNRYNLLSKDGIKLLKNYIKFYQTGGASETGGASKIYGSLPNVLLEEIPSRAGPTIKCPKTESDKFLSISKYNEELAEAEVEGENKLLYNKLLYNNKILKYIQAYKKKYPDSEHPIIMTWVLWQNPIEEQTGLKTARGNEHKLYTLCAVHNDSVYEYSAKHNTILSRLNIPNMLFIASGEFMYVEAENAIRWNLQSGTFYNYVILEEFKKTYSEGNWGFMLEDTLKKLITNNEATYPPLKFMFDQSTFITKDNIVTPQFMEKLNMLKTKYPNEFEYNLVDKEINCKQYVNAPIIERKIKNREMTIRNLEKNLERYEGKPNIQNIIRKNIVMFQAEIVELKKKLPKPTNSGGGVADTSMNSSK